MCKSMFNKYRSKPAIALDNIEEVVGKMLEKTEETHDKRHCYFIYEENGNYKVIKPSEIEGLKVLLHNNKIFFIDSHETHRNETQSMLEFSCSKDVLIDNLNDTGCLAQENTAIQPL